MADAWPVGGVAVLLVAQDGSNEDPDNEPVEVIRIISAGKVDKSERRRYEEG